MNKITLLQQGKAVLLARREELTRQLNDLQKDLSEDTKSSVGDKYETSRAMGQQEIGKIQVQLAETNRQLALIPALETQKESTTIENGSLIQTDHGWFYIGIPLGVVEADQQRIYFISPSAPLAQQLLGKKSGDRCLVNATSYTIESVH